MIRAALKTREMVMPQAYVAPWPCELVTNIPAVQYNSGTERHWRRVIHCLVPDVQPNDILQCKACFEVTNNLGFVVELAAAMLLTPQAAGTAGIENLTSVSSPQEPSDGKFITRCPGFNVTPQMHHAMFPLAKDYIVPEGASGDQYVAIMAYCGGLQYWPTSHSIVVEQWCADISVTRIRT
jgi:hypothetical protein